MDEGRQAVCLRSGMDMLANVSQAFSPKVLAFARKKNRWGWMHDLSNGNQERAPLFIVRCFAVFDLAAGESRRARAGRTGWQRNNRSPKSGQAATGDNTSSAAIFRY